MYNFSTKGVCAKNINFQINEGKLTNVEFIGGCPGNLIGISTLVEGLTPEEAVNRLKGITCGRKSTSCPDQLAIAIEELVLVNV
ncbi:TIGR03905 family TSCPD domain-containing protein [Oceanirhabdus sp. W0125-5]|uniref:TIGR03905 family TSCPD domain-containing protein n=1 Tax=Oceanirhabdus sp. W0125-5 TaxID=2999116 RepID=UPI0022F33FE7|nr:TIGR03905 family TSCPD domain-containing protein [Oceanirhabdus sp. W0125-5]WBW99372.1 TIGR03905 family TSCPD domain-containing protein [Oceanirhabdus sp. W0125-5]